MRFTGKRVLVTGASSGIGTSTALILAQEGADVAYTYHHNEAGANQLKEQINSLGKTPYMYQTDMTNDKAVSELAAQVEKDMGPIDILINNAGGLVERMLFFEIDRDNWDKIMQLNLWSVILLSQKVGESMKKRGQGVIVNNASVAGRFGGGPGAMAYSTAKGALITATQGMARELITHGIRVNAVAPGIIDTPFHEKFTSKEVMQQLMSKVPINRPGTALEVAKTICFLASEDSSYMVGATLDVNGGMWVI